MLFPDLVRFMGGEEVKVGGAVGIQMEVGEVGEMRLMEERRDECRV